LAKTTVDGYIQNLKVKTKTLVLCEAPNHQVEEAENTLLEIFALAIGHGNSKTFLAPLSLSIFFPFFSRCFSASLT